MTWTRCPVCKAKVQRNKYGQLLPHTRIEITSKKDDPQAVVCEAYHRGAKAA